MTITVRCPCCDQMMEVEQRGPKTHWTLRQVLVVRRMMRNGIPAKVIGRLFNASQGAIHEFNRRTPRVVVPALSVSIEERDAA